MEDDKDKTGALPGGDSGKRTPPTIDLAASDVTESPRAPDAQDTAADEPGSTAESPAEAASEPQASSPQMSRTSSVLVTALTGGIAAVLVIGAATFAGWPKLPAPESTAPLADNIASNKAEIAALGARVAKVETESAKPAPRPVADPALVTRIDALEKSMASLRSDLAAVRAQGDKTVAALSEIKSASPQVATGATQAAPSVDVSAIEERIARIERATAALNAAAAAPPQPPVEDPNVRRLDALINLDKAMRHDAPYATALAAARSVVGDADVLKPLDPFAHTGIPGVDALCKELLALLPQLAPKPGTQPAPSGVVERLQQSLAKLVRIQRTDAPPSGSAGIIARATAAAQRNDLNEAKRELLQLPPSERVLARPWIAKVDARDKALAASEQFTMDTLTAISRRAR
ncbi:hypothetical protein [Bradyrhizobium sp. G127]|uniref:COG4223 family protein n=1 Tax=Bradyrhizobium sp. G127 TaxID=2904800 RepID=UPI001F3A4155|nr:hypothetical protein [Bradyrhizobium sp. G127]MCF2521348.1 hypothetical protein [Bradyrhizobium sp. G127]